MRLEHHNFMYGTHSNPNKSIWYLRDLGPKVLVLLGVLQEVNKLHDLQLGLLAPGHVLELDVDLVTQHFGRGFADAEQATHAPAGPPGPRGSSPQHEEQEADDECGGKHAEEERAGEKKKINLN